MNGFKAHLQNGGTYSSGTDDLSLAGGAYRLMTWKVAAFAKGWEIDVAAGALYARTPGLKLLRGYIWNTAGLTAGGTNTIKITRGGNPAQTVTQDGADVDAAIHIASAAGGTGGFNFGGVANMAAGEFLRVWYLPASAGSVTVNGHLAHTMFEGVDNGGGYSY